MIDLTIKTLDSQNRPFNVPEDYTVRQLKEHIAESVNIAPDVQRLIYCGRVLVDENKLSTYNVHGKVIHLVERAPPSSSAGRGDPDGATQGGEGGGWRFLGGGRGRRRAGDNTMYLGAMAFPAELMDPRGMAMNVPPALNNRPCLTRSRLMVARSILNTAARTLGRLENPRVPPASESEISATPEESHASQASNQGESQETVPLSRRGSTSGESQSEDNDEVNLNLATRAATAAALVSAVSAVMQDTASSSARPAEDTVEVTIEEVETQSISLLDDTEDVTSPISPIVLSPESPPEETPLPPSSSNMETEPETGTTSGATADVPSSGTEQVANENTQSGTQQQRTEPPRPQSMAAVIAQLDELNRRLQPFMTQYYNLLHHDPNYEDPEIIQTAAQYNFPPSPAEADTLFRSVSETMHSLSHAYHALSDIMCSYQRQPSANGRVLRCRPVLIQHSAVLHTPVPLLLDRGALNNRASSAPSSTASSVPVSSTSSTSPVSVSNSSNSSSLPSYSAAQSTPAQPTANTASTTQANVGTPRVSFSPNNLDIFMELGPTITIDSVEATFLPRPAGQATANATATGHTNANSTPLNVPLGDFPWGSAPPPELIQNLVQAVSERMGDAGEANIHIAFPEISINTSRSATGGNTAPNATTTSSSASTSPTNAGSRPGAPDAQNSQARGNTETHPTTATQTRSTSRPQILLARNLSSVTRNVQNQLRAFDPFLPCNSHHLRNRRHGVTRPPINEAASNNNNNNNNASTQATNGRSTQAAGGPPNVISEMADLAAGLNENLTSYLMGRSQAGGPGPNILALGPFGVGPSATANISFEIGRVPINLAPGQSGLGPRTGPPASDQGSGQAPPPVPRVETNSTASGVNNSPAGATGGFLSALLGQLGNLIPSAAGAEMVNGGMRNAGGTSGVGSGATGGEHWVEIPTRRFFSNEANAQIFQNRRFMQDRILNLTRRRNILQELLSLGLGNGDLDSDNPSLVSLLGLHTNVAVAHRSYLHDLCYTILNGIRLHDLNILMSGPGMQERPQESVIGLIGEFMSRHHPEMTEDMLDSHFRVVRDEIETFLNSVPEVQSHVLDGVDVRATLGRFHQEWLRNWVRDMRGVMRSPASADSSSWPRNFIVEKLKSYLQALVVVLGLCFDSSHLPTLITAVVRRLVSGLTGDNASTPFYCTSPAGASRLNRFLSALPDLIGDVASLEPEVDGRRYLVHTTELPRPPRIGVTPQVTLNPGPRGGEPMDIELAADVSQVASAPVNTRPDDPLPDNIVIGSETWHNTVPSDWVPIITRDNQRQRRDSNPAPFSDAYLSGMPTKRRKIVTSNKPSTSLGRIISDTMSTALTQAGVSNASQVEAIASAASHSSAMRVAYRDQLQAQLGDTLAANSDFTSERFPNAAKFFGAKKKQ